MVTSRKIEFHNYNNVIIDMGYPDTPRLRIARLINLDKIFRFLFR